MPVPGEDQAAWLTDDDTDEIDALLTAASPDTSTWPGDGRARRWAGIHTDGGSLAAVLADTSRSASVGHLSSIATAPARRRQGHGAALTAWVTRQMLIDGAVWATLGMYADNDPARGRAADSPNPRRSSLTTSRSAVSAGQRIPHPAIGDARVWNRAWRAGVQPA